MEESKATRIRLIAERLEQIEKATQEIRDGSQISSVCTIRGGTGNHHIGVNQEGTKRAIAALILAELTGEAQGLWAELAKISTGDA